jgi:hypothetical protein
MSHLDRYSNRMKLCLVREFVGTRTRIYLLAEVQHKLRCRKDVTGVYQE